MVRAAPETVQPRLNGMDRTGFKTINRLWVNLLWDRMYAGTDRKMPVTGPQHHAGSLLVYWHADCQT
jgi:hypothetical protein